MSTSSELKIQVTPAEYFHERVSKASSKLKMQLEPEVEFYLVNLLTEFINPSSLNQEFDSDVLSTPLVFLLKQTLEAPESRRPVMYRRLGDTTLYVSGFFQDYFNDKLFDMSYFVTMGASAYQQAARLQKSLLKDTATSDVLENLSANFLQIVDVIAESSETVDQKPTSLLSIYDRWNRCGSERLRSILEENGITPVQVPLKLAQ